MNSATKIHRSLGILAALTLLSGGVAVAQEAEQGRADRMLRLLPLGDPPPWEEINDGVRRIQKEPPPGSVPPHEVVQLDAAGIERGDPVRLRLNHITEGLPVGAAAVLYDLEDVGAGAEPWLKLAMPAKSHGLALLFRNPRVEKPKWDTPLSLVLPEDLTSFPPGSIRFVNVSPWDAEFSIAGQVVRLGSRKHATSRPRGAFQKQPLEVTIVSQAGERKKIGDQAINQNAGQRTSIFVYKADGEDARSFAKLKLITENATALPQLPRR